MKDYILKIGSVNIRCLLVVMRLYYNKNINMTQLRNYIKNYFERNLICVLLFLKSPKPENDYFDHITSTMCYPKEAMSVLLSHCWDYI